MTEDVSEERWSIVKAVLREFPDLRARALLFILETRARLSPGYRLLVRSSFLQVHRAVAGALDELREMGLQGETLFSSEKGYHLVLLAPAPRDEEGRSREM